MNITYDMAIKQPNVKQLHGVMLCFVDECEPLRGSRLSAGVDLRAAQRYDVMPRSFELIRLGVWWDQKCLKYFSDIGYLDVENYYGGLYLRSSFGKSLIIPNGKGVIDIDYNCEFMVRVFNPSPQRIIQIGKSERVAQLVLERHYTHELGFYTTVERDGGFGSTGKK